jgi:TPP-dependent pyruvate/acetoin dehydrogenase alpha subunit
MKKSLELNLYRSMYRIRAVEEEIAKRYPEGNMRCPTHLSIGQEAVPAALSECAEPTDFAVSTHRGHAHYLGKGGDLKSMIAEIYGKAAGCAKGKGGSMHLIDLSVKFMGTSAIVGNSIPLGIGLALSAQLKKTDQVSCIFLGDGAIEEGAFYESANFAAVRKLPVLFICENNFYSVYSPLSVRQPKERSISRMVEAMGIPSRECDGNDVMATQRLMQDAFRHVRSGEGPMFLEFFTYRWREHCGPYFDNDLGYRTQEEFEEWHKREPITALEKKIQSEKPELISSLESIQNEVNQEVLEAFAFAEDAPFPDPSQAFEGTYA